MSNLLKILASLTLLNCCYFHNTIYAKIELAGEIFPPFSYMENGKQVDISLEILQEILKEANLPDTILFHPWSRAYNIALTIKNAAVL